MDRTVTKAILSVVVSFAAATLLVPPAHARGRGAPECLAPNETDDTEALQSALEECTSRRRGRTCEVSLCAGVFRTGALRVGDFRGVLRGAGRDKTVIVALPNLEVNDNPLGYWLDDPLDGAPWPYLLQFIGGRARIRDLAIEVPSPEGDDRPTTGWSGGWFWRDELAAAVLLTGQHPVDFDVRRIRVVGGPDGDEGTALLAGVHFQGLIFNPDDGGDYPVHPVRGRFRMSDSELVGMLTGTPLWEMADARVTLARNHYRSIVGMEVIDATRSRVKVYSNGWDVEAVGFQAVLNIDGEPSEKNTFIVHSNHGSIGTLVSFASGIYFWDPGILDGEAEGSTVVFSRNRLLVGEEGRPVASGIEAWGARRLWVYRNTVAGDAQLGIVADDTSGCGVLGNALGELDPTGGADILLGPGTRGCLAVVGQDDVVQDDGTDNWIFRH